LLSRRRPLSPREDERERITNARRAAEALFTTKRQVTKQSVADPLSSVSQSEHKPRVLKALSRDPVSHQEGNAPSGSEHRITAEIPSSLFPRIRAWVKYGVTAAQVAGMYGVTVDVIERILTQG
jgi:hypothetical protein